MLAQSVVVALDIISSKKLNLLFFLGGFDQGMSYWQLLCHVGFLILEIRLSFKELYSAVVHHLSLNRGSNVAASKKVSDSS